jgi:hypothetical protein
VDHGTLSSRKACPLPPYAKFMLHFWPVSTQIIYTNTRIWHLTVLPIDVGSLRSRGGAFLVTDFWGRRGWTSERRRELGEAARCHKRLPPGPSLQSCCCPWSYPPPSLAGYGPSRRICLALPLSSSFDSLPTRAPGKRGLVTLQIAGYDTIGCTMR